VDTDKGSSKPKVSVIVPIRRGETITGLAWQLSASTYENIELIVVDEGLERSVQRNMGIDSANGEYLLILDSDQWVTIYLIEECVKLMEKYDALYIPEVLRTRSMFDVVRNWERQFYTGTPVDCVRFVRADRCPKFDETMSGPEDSDWDRRVYGRRGITKNVVEHVERVSMLGYFKKKAYYAESMKRFEEKHPKDKVTNFWWRCFGVFFEKGKWKRVIRAPHMFLAVMIILFVRGVIYMVNK